MQRRLIFIFPGQASQYVGMGKDFYDNCPAAKSMLDKILTNLELEHIRELCFDGPSDLLTRTDNVQPAITAVSLMALAALNDAGGRESVSIVPSACAGHSLGEYTAHAAAENISPEKAVKLVKFRGRWMNEAAQPPNPAGAMVAVIGMILAEVEALLAEPGSKRVGIANLNSPGQIILSGEKEAVETVSEMALEAGAKRCVMLNVSGAWHSPLMLSAQDKMRELLAEEISDDNIPISGEVVVVANATAEIVRNAGQLKDTLTDQITAPVRWESCVRKLISELGYPGLPSELDEKQLVDLEPFPLFVEIGPGKALRGLMRNIDRKLVVKNVEDMAGVNALIDSIRKM